MTSNPNSGQDRAGTGSSGEFDTVELNRTVPVVPQGTAAGDVLSGSGTTSASTMGSAGATQGGGESQFRVSGTTSGSQSSGGQAMGAAREVAGQARDTVGQVAEQARDTAGQVVDQARETVSSQLQTQKDRVASGLEVVAQAIRDTGRTVREREQPQAAVYIDRAAEQVERVQTFLRDREVGEMVWEVERYARRNPAMFLGGTFLLGLLASRFLKSSSSYEEEYEYRGGQYPTTPYRQQGYTYTSRPTYPAPRRPAASSYGTYREEGYDVRRGQQGGAFSSARQGASYGSYEGVGSGTSGGMTGGTTRGVTGGTTSGMGGGTSAGVGPGAGSTSDLGTGTSGGLGTTGGSTTGSSYGSSGSSGSGREDL